MEGFDLDLEPGRLVALVGPSGCGKSTLLRLVAGLRPLDAGSVEGAPSRKAFVFQEAALLPWLDVLANAALPGRYGPIGDVPAALAAVGLQGLERRLPRQLSGGQRMRVSLARALVARPELVLLDEPFAALDGMTRRAVRGLVADLHRREGWTTLLVTHEIDDALALADRIVALDGPPLRVVLDGPAAGLDREALEAPYRGRVAE